MSVTIESSRRAARSGIVLGDWQVQALSGQSCAIGFSVTNHTAQPQVITAASLSLEIAAVSRGSGEATVTLQSAAIIDPGERTRASVTFAAATREQVGAWARAATNLYLRGTVTVQPEAGGDSQEIQVAVVYEPAAGRWRTL